MQGHSVHHSSGVKDDGFTLSWGFLREITARVRLGNVHVLDFSLLRHSVMVLPMQERSFVKLIQAVRRSVLLRWDAAQFVTWIPFIEIVAQVMNHPRQCVGAFQKNLICIEEELSVEPTSTHVADYLMAPVARCCFAFSLHPSVLLKTTSC